MKQGDYIVIHSWMVSELGLKGNELIIYALIHGFCKDGKHEFTGSISYISEWANISNRAVIFILQKLVEKKLLLKEERSVNNVKICAYKIGSEIFSGVVKFFQGGSEKTSQGGSEKTSHNKDNIDKDKYNKEINKESDPFELFCAFCKKYRKYGGRVRSMETEFENFKKKHKDWQEIIPMLDYALEKENKEREQATRRGDFFPVMKNLQTYINQRSWEMYSEGFEDYDPNEYHPNGYYVRYMERDDYYLYIGSYPDAFFSDGYKDTDRPDGATLVLNNARGTLIWRAATKTWELTR